MAKFWPHFAHALVILCLIATNVAASDYEPYSYASSPPPPSPRWLPPYLYKSPPPAQPKYYYKSPPPPPPNSPPPPYISSATHWLLISVLHMHAGY
ncbi:hypothetical protein TorRG33x02_354350 [Trema orientale]|uniref:Extensin domain containing protein n=1 Tax=Trema orientale TaxID=63057 RepID=A0A2P5ABB5_TREOI|nr:hypothetical protein TorRG33x02_354350 [Trema orientale]